MEHTVTHNPEQNVFFVEHDGETAYLSYQQLPDGTLDYAHTYTPNEVRGLGIASAIIRYALDYARENDIRIIPSCPFVESYIDRHSEYADLVAPSS